MSLLSKIFGSKPEPPPPPVNLRIREILADYADELEERRVNHGPLWIFRRGMDHGAYARRLEAVVDESRFAGASAAIADDAGEAWSCSCRCRVHMRKDCIRCLLVERCPVHAEPDPETLRPATLEEPEMLAKELQAAYCEVADSYGAPTFVMDWDSLPEGHRRAFTEALRRVVCSRVAVTR